MKMTNKILTITLLTLILLNGCNETKKQKDVDSSTQTAKVDDEKITKSYTDAEGNLLEITYSNKKGNAILKLKEEIIELFQQKTASGFLYSNDNYELIGKGNDIELSKDGEVLFVHEDDIIKNSLRDSIGQTLDIVINNTKKEAKVYLNGGKQINLKREEVGNEFLYKNEQYELKGTGENFQLFKNGELVFKK